MTNKDDDDNKKDVGSGEHDLWKLYTRDIQPLDPERPKRIDGVAGPLKSPAKSAKKNEASLAPTLQAQENKEDPQTDRRTAQKLKRGQIAFEAKIDLHGLYREQAKTRLIGFIEQSYHAGMRCVLVITGKGKLILDGEKADENTPGVIRRNFQNWIKEAPLKSYILSVEKAQIRHGGAGAFYVLLKRKRR